jgi:nucleoside-diphosphate kinase
MHQKSINERCLVLLKADCVKRKLIGTFIARIEAANLSVVALHMLIPTETLIARHYKEDPEWLRNAGQKKIDHYKEKGIEFKETATEIGQQIRANLISSMAGKKVLAMVIQGPNSVRFLRKLAGATEPLSAEPGTLRGSFSSDSYEIADIEARTIQNLIHVSDGFETAKKEIEMWFPEGLYEKQD